MSEFTSSTSISVAPVTPTTGQSAATVTEAALLALVDQAAFEAAGQAMGDERWPAMHKILDSVWLGAQTAAGAFPPYWDTEAAREEAFKNLKDNNITHIVCCCGNAGEDSGQWTKLADRGKTA
jgi:hypothetical protein